MQLSLERVVGDAIFGGKCSPTKARGYPCQSVYSLLMTTKWSAWG
jgi:hypothetical protein